MKESILKSDGLYHVYESKAEDGNVVALRGLHIDMKEGEAIAVVGPSGSGKSTLMKCLGGLMKASAGSVSLAGKKHDSPHWTRISRVATKDRFVHFSRRKSSAADECP